MTDAERREKARLRSERWRRAHGIMPRYRRRKQAREIVRQGKPRSHPLTAPYPVPKPSQRH